MKPDTERMFAQPDCRVCHACHRSRAVTDTREVIADLAREAQLQQLSGLDAMDTKAATLIGFAGVVLGLMFTAPAAAERWNVVMTAGAAAVVAGVVPLAVSLVPRKYAFNPSIAALREGWGDADPSEVHEVTTQSIIRALLTNGESLRFKALFVRAGVMLIVCGLFLATTGVLYAVNSKPRASPVTKTLAKGKKG